MARAPITAFLAMAGMAWFGGANACDAPKEPGSLPDPATASEPDMVAAQANVKQYLTGMEARLKCLESTKDTDRYNDSVSQMQKVAGKFNAIVRAYRARTAG